ncbi:hypothetical protein [Aestuariirhabdus litorea]|uniref:DUF1513 domain-containing protein n=1 Tax=Aestuariirhabdus litorea TaxID=2528527 RepID=A0A3P3VRI8_9GAMM|nr:hypothetical protein [Aestuariirhabdus litorea]RRJ84608.1 hypothetical protein D0544_05750 [Aestuariirhabdus litorea]RWW97834.1 hypothetical protein DZC74_05745 [Endozoicomonadaceae bacterium GTF-13]
MIRTTALLCLLQLLLSPPLSADEQWQVRPFVGSLSGGPAFGQMLQTGSGLHHLCGTEDGSLFLASGQRIDRIDPDGQRWPIAGDGFEGLIDGPAALTRFRMGVGAYYRSHNLACAHPGLVFIGDTGNKRVRRLQLQGKNWVVDTVAGGGGEKKALPGTYLKGGSLDLGNTFSIALQDQTQLIIATRYGAWSLHLPSDQASWLGAWPESTSTWRGSAKLNLMMGDADRLGNSYFVSRTPDVVVRVSAEGKLEHFAGIVARHPKPHHIGDGAPREAYFDTPNSLVVAPDGSAVYVCGGDEYDIRRVPTAPGEPTQTLMRNGRWGHASLHPNKARGPAVFSPQETGTLMPQGTLSVMMVSPLYGRDWAGNLYAGLVPWRGMSQFVAGKGVLPTHSFTLYRFAP